VSCVRLFQLFPGLRCTSSRLRLLLAAFMSTPDSVVGRNNGGAFFLLNILVSSLYFILPLLFGLVMAWAGFAVGGAVNGALSGGFAASGGASSAAGASSNAAGQVPRAFGGIAGAGAKGASRAGNSAKFGGR